MGSFSIWHLLILLIVVVLIFGTKRLTGGAKDLGNAVKEFKKAVRDDEAKTADPVDPVPPPADVTRVQKPPPVVAPGDDRPPRD